VAAARFPAGTPFARSSFPRHHVTMSQYASFALNAPAEALFRNRLRRPSGALSSRCTIFEHAGR
jgi:hypothetical protein